MTEEWEAQFDEIEKNLREMEKKPDEGVFQFLTTITEHFKQRAIANAPIDTQALRDQMEATSPRRVGDIMVATVGTPVDYGLEIHEGQFPEGNKYQLGRRTVQQPDTPEGGAGGGFLRRVSDYHVRDYTVLFGVILGSSGKS